METAAAKRFFNVNAVLQPVEEDHDLFPVEVRPACLPLGLDVVQEVGERRVLVATSIVVLGPKSEVEQGVQGDLPLTGPSP